MNAQTDFLSMLSSVGGSAITERERDSAVVTVVDDAAVSTGFGNPNLFFKPFLVFYNTRNRILRTVYVRMFTRKSLTDI